MLGSHPGDTVKSASKEGLPTYEFASNSAKPVQLSPRATGPCHKERVGICQRAGRSRRLPMDKTWRNVESIILQWRHSLRQGSTSSTPPDISAPLPLPQCLAEYMTVGRWHPFREEREKEGGERRERGRREERKRVDGERGEITWGTGELSKLLPSGGTTARWGLGVNSCIIYLGSTQHGSHDVNDMMCSSPCGCWQRGHGATGSRDVGTGGILAQEGGLSGQPQHKEPCPGMHAGAVASSQ